jgi:hypothetical protein
VDDIDYACLNFCFVFRDLKKKVTQITNLCIDVSPIPHLWFLFRRKYSSSMMFSLWGHFHVFNSHKLMICVCTFWKLYEIVGNCNAVKLKHYSISPLTFYRNIGEWRMGPRRSMRQARTPPWIPIMGLCFCPQT